MYFFWKREKISNNNNLLLGLKPYKHKQHISSKDSVINNMQSELLNLLKNRESERPESEQPESEQPDFDLTDYRELDDNHDLQEETILSASPDPFINQIHTLNNVSPPSKQPKLDIQVS